MTATPAHAGFGVASEVARLRATIVHRPGPLRPMNLRWDMLHADDFLLPPLPNHLFQCNNSC